MSILPIIEKEVEIGTMITAISGELIVNIPKDPNIRLYVKVNQDQI